MAENPRTIFTSSAWAYDDLFKIWTAEKVENGSKLIIGQHGGHMGVSKFSFYEDYQMKISDTFLSWGWSSNVYKHVKPVGNIKCIDKRKK